MRHSISVLLAYTCLALLASHPLWQWVGERVPGDIGDPVLNVYILAWDTRALSADLLTVFHANIFYPLPNTLAYSENLIGSALLALPIALLSGQPIITYNFVYLSSFTLAGFGMYLLILHWTRQRAAAFIAGIAFAFAPYRLASLAHIQLLTAQWLPFIAYSGWRIADGRWQRNKRTLLILFFVFLWLQIASSLHGALFAMFLIAAFFISHLLRLLRSTVHGSRFTVHASRLTVHGSRFTHLLLFPLISLMSFILLLLPLVLPYLAVMPELRAARPPDVALSFLAQPTDFLAAFPWNRLFGAMTAMFRNREGFVEEQTLFMGIVAPLLALPGLWRRNWVVGWLGGLMVGSALLMTSALFVQWLPLTSLMRVPSRWGVVLTFALAGLCGLGVAHIRPHRFSKPVRFWLFSSIAILVFVEGFSAPIPLAKLGLLQMLPPVYHYLAQLPDRAAILELPLYVAPDAEFPEAKRMVATALHGHPLVNGYSGFTPARQIELAARLKNFPDHVSLTALRELRQQGVRYLIVHSGEPGLPRREWVQTNRERAKQSGLLRFVQTFNDDDLFEIVSE
jgi:hypothetical protein